MPPAAFSRRMFGAMLAGAGVAWPLAPRAEITVNIRPDASPFPDHYTYVPPSDLKTISDMFRRMTAPVSVNGAGPFPFVVDTGANQSVISRELAGQLGLTIGPEQALNGVAGVQMTPTTKARIGVGSRIEDGVLMSVLPGDTIGGSGMLGLDRVDGGRLTLDFRRQMLRIEDRGAHIDRLGEIAMKAHRRDGQLTLVDADLGGMKLTAFLDSGAQNTIGNLALREQAITRYPMTSWNDVPIISVTGQTINAAFADLPGLRIGDLTLASWPVAFADLHTFRMWKLVDRPAILLGVDVLSRFETVCLDFARDEVRFRLPSVV